MKATSLSTIALATQLCMSSITFAFSTTKVVALNTFAFAFGFATPVAAC